MAKNPRWARPGAADEFGNIACKKCGYIQSPSYRACLKCCPHNRLALTEGWHGDDDGGGWELEVECAKCGKDCDFGRKTLMRDYAVVRKRRG